MADVLTQSSSMAPEMQIFYDKVFLENAELVQKYSMLAEKKTMPKNGGKVVQFVRTAHFSPITAGLSEGINPTAVGFTSENVTATVQEYGFGTKISSLFSLTTIDTGLEQKVKELAYHAGLSLDTILRDVAVAGATTQFAGSKTVATAVNSTDTFSAVELRRAHKTLFVNAAPTFENGRYRGILDAEAEYQLKGDTSTGNWLNINTYNSGENAELIKKGVIGHLFGIDLIPTNNAPTVGIGPSSTNTGYATIIAGKGALAEVSISGQGGNYIIKKDSGSQDTSNPLNMFSTLAWKVDSYAAKVLNGQWIISCVHA